MKRSLSYCKQAILISDSVPNLECSVFVSQSSRGEKGMWSCSALRNASWNGAAQSPTRTPCAGLQMPCQRLVTPVSKSYQALSTPLGRLGPAQCLAAGAEVVRVASEPLLPAQRGALRASRAGVEGGTELGPREAVLVYRCLRSHRHVVGEASAGRGSGPRV